MSPVPFVNGYHRRKKNWFSLSKLVGTREEKRNLSKKTEENRRKRDDEAEREKSVRFLVIVVEHSTGREKRGDTCALKVVVLDEMTTILLLGSKSRKENARLPENNHNETHAHTSEHTQKGLSLSLLSSPSFQHFFASIRLLACF